jgi:hypothetical protein
MRSLRYIWVYAVLYMICILTHPDDAVTIFALRLNKVLVDFLIFES